MKAADTGAWVDFGGLARTRAAARATGEMAGARREEALASVARQFESVFVNMMLESMRDASFGDPLLDSSATNHYRDMLDHQLSMEMTEQGGIGLADMLVRQLSPLVRQATGAEPAPDPFVSTADRAPLVDLPREEVPPAQPVSPGTAANETAAARTDAARADAATPDSVRAGAERAAPGAAPAPLTDGAVTIGRLREPGPPAEVRPLAANPGHEVRTDEARFDGPEDFVARTWPHAERVAAELGVEPAVLVAQAALETGWGRHVMGAGRDASSHNLFGIKADRRWDGPSVTVSTVEYEDGVMHRVRAPFRAYDSLAASFEDYARFIGGQDRYSRALEAARANGGDGETYIRELQQAGYATDPKYADKVVDVMRRTIAALENPDSVTL